MMSTQQQRLQFSRKRVKNGPFKEDDREDRPKSMNIQFPSPPEDDITQQGWKQGGVEDYPGLDADLIPSTSPEETTPVPTTGTSNNKQHLQLRFRDPLLGGPEYASTSMVEDALLLSSDMKDYLFLADEALLDVFSRAQPMILNRREVAAERELALLARDKAYYDELHQRAAARRVDPSNRFRSDADDLLRKLQNRLLDAYQLMKDPEGRKGLTDQYNQKIKSTEESTSIEHAANTLYVNVMVKNSVQVVRHELERLARQRWEMTEEAEKFTRFERFRMLTQTNMVKLAGLALASDFTVRYLFRTNSQKRLPSRTWIDSHTHTKKFVISMNNSSLEESLFNSPMICIDFSLLV
jgi:hypothetical protein